MLEVLSTRRILYREANLLERHSPVIVRPQDVGAARSAGDEARPAVAAFGQHQVEAAVSIHIPDAHVG